MNIAIILAAGSGKRMKLKENKLFLEINHKPLLVYTLEKFIDHSDIDEIVLVMRKGEAKKIIKKIPLRKKKVHLITGGTTRQLSAEAAINYIQNVMTPHVIPASHVIPVSHVIPAEAGIQGKKAIIVFHNGANPLVTIKEISDVIKAAKEYGAAFVGHKVADTIKKYEKNQTQTINRKNLIAAQTPQAVKFGILLKGIEIAKKKNIKVTDDIAYAELAGSKVKFIEASENNFKITTKQDLEFLKYLVRETKISVSPRRALQRKFLTGIASDSHNFDRTHKGLVLAGIRFANHPKLKANSDGDVILHAITTALSQAIGGPSLGKIADPLFEKGITDSKKYLEKILKQIHQKHLYVSHIGIHIEGKIPYIDHISEKLKESLAKILKMKKADIGITAASGEELTSFGRGKGLHCLATVNLSTYE